MTAKQLLKILVQCNPDDEISFANYNVNGHIVDCIEKADIVVVKNKHYSFPDYYDIEMGEMLH